MGKKRGWFEERVRHALAAKGTKTKQVSRGVHRVIDKDRKAELQRGINIAEQAGDRETVKDLRGALKRESQVVEVVEEVVEKAPKDEPEEKEEKKDKKKGLRW